jgi:hypothetical protein
MNLEEMGIALLWKGNARKPEGATLGYVIDAWKGLY